MLVFICTWAHVYVNIFLSEDNFAILNSVLNLVFFERDTLCTDSYSILIKDLQLIN
jgi:hypothetical protein